MRLNYKKSEFILRLNCKKSEFILRLNCKKSEFILRMNCKKFQKPLGLVSEEKSGKLLKKGAIGYLVYLVNQPKDKNQIEQVLVVKEFMDDFLEKIK